MSPPRSPRRRAKPRKGKPRKGQPHEGTPKQGTPKQGPPRPPNGAWPEGFLVGSQLESWHWPGMPGDTAKRVLGLLFQMERSQWWSPEALLQHQFRQLGQLLEHAYRHVAFYRPRLQEAAEMAPRGKLTAEKWARIPILTRQQIQAAGADIHSAEVPASHGTLREQFTSGSTGTPIRTLGTRVRRAVWDAVSIRQHLWHRRDLRGKLALIRTSKPGADAYPEGGTQPNWGSPATAGLETGPCVSLNINASLAEQAEWLQRHEPDYLLSHPTNIGWLARHCLERGIVLPRLRQILTIAELLKPEVRDLAREAWGVAIADVYSTRDAGYVALQCPAFDHYHVQAEAAMVEVLDEAGRPCRPGETGRVVITPLHNFAMPLIRYEIGDWAEVGPPCPCGRGLPVLARIHGRSHNMLVLPSGERRRTLMSTADANELLEAAPIRQFQFVQKSLETLELRLAVPRPLTAAEEARLRAWAEGKFGDHLTFVFKYYEEIPRTAAGKFHDFISEVER